MATLSDLDHRSTLFAYQITLWAGDSLDSHVSLILKAVGIFCVYSAKCLISVIKCFFLLKKNKQWKCCDSVLCTLQILYLLVRRILSQIPALLSLYVDIRFHWHRHTVSRSSCSLLKVLVWSLSSGQTLKIMAKFAVGLSTQDWFCHILYCIFPSTVKWEMKLI